MQCGVPGAVRTETARYLSDQRKRARRKRTGVVHVRPPVADNLPPGGIRSLLQPAGALDEQLRHGGPKGSGQGGIDIRVRGT